MEIKTIGRKTQIYSDCIQMCICREHDALELRVMLCAVQYGMGEQQSLVHWSVHHYAL